jgi:hypothetical protein
MPRPSYEFEHLRFDAFAETKDYQKRGGGDFKVPENIRDNRVQHGQRILDFYREAVNYAEEQLQHRDPAIAEGVPGYYLQFESHPGFHLYPKLDSRARTREKDILAAAFNEAVDGNELKEKITVFVPSTRTEHYVRKVRRYMTENTGITGEPKEYKFAESIERIKSGLVEVLWTDPRPLPEPGEIVWWEVWTWDTRTENVLKVANKLQLPIEEKVLKFPEMQVIAIQATRETMGRMMLNSDGIAELRCASDNPDFFITLTRREQRDWTLELVSRIQPPAENSPVVCVLDTGMNREHPLLSPALQEDSCYTLHPAWGTHDHDPDGHGSSMGGCVLYGDLTPHLSTTELIRLTHRIESVKLLPPNGFPNTHPLWFAPRTLQAFSYPETTSPESNRIYCMAVTNRDISGHRPTAWSSALDQLAAGVEEGQITAEENAARRLIIVSAGNVRNNFNHDGVYKKTPIEDPAQAWNVLTIGAYTKLCTITEDSFRHHEVVAEAGDLSPYSRTSTNWPKRTPIKPDVVFEGGNAGVGADGFAGSLNSLSILTTGHDHTQSPFTTFLATSAATAQAANFAGKLAASVPGIWPETLRALIVHGANWTPKMRQSIKITNSKSDNLDAVRIYGFGVPDLERSCRSAKNDLTLFAQDTIKPFKKSTSGSAHKFNQIKYFSLPWPEDELQNLGATNVRLKVTLSYFIEPAPESSKIKDPYSYASFGLRFLLRSPLETSARFRRRVNRAEDSDGLQSSNDEKWLFGPKSISAGSLHCDIWEGPAAELARCGEIAVFPVSGWWRTRKRLECFDKTARFSLLVSISAPEVDIDLRTPILTQIQNRIEQTVET